MCSVNQNRIFLLNENVVQISIRSTVLLSTFHETCLVGPTYEQSLAEQFTLFGLRCSDGGDPNEKDVAKDDVAVILVPAAKDDGNPLEELPKDTGWSWVCLAGE